MEKQELGFGERVESMVCDLREGGRKGSEYADVKKIQSGYGF